jgi:hypothetical protein
VGRRERKQSKVTGRDEKWLARLASAAGLGVAERRGRGSAAKEEACSARRCAAGAFSGRGVRTAKLAGVGGSRGRSKVSAWGRKRREAAGNNFSVAVAVAAAAVPARLGSTADAGEAGQSEWATLYVKE